jgi:hypothetical protein
MDLVLGLEPTPASGLVWSGVSGRKMGKLDPGASLVLTLCLVPLTAGLQVRVTLALFSLRSRHVIKRR